MLEFPLIPNKDNTQIFDIAVIKNEAYDVSLSTLIDSGASIPTWVDGESLFNKVFPKAILQTDTKSILRGFGGKGEIAPVYVIPEFRLQDRQSQTVTFKNLPIVVTKRDFSFEMIMSYTMLSKMNVQHTAYAENNGNYTPLNPEVRLFPHKQTYYARYTQQPVSRLDQSLQKLIDTPHYIERTVVFVQD